MRQQKRKWKMGRERLSKKMKARVIEKERERGEVRDKESEKEGDKDSITSNSTRA